MSTVPQATSKNALVNVVLSLVQAHEKFRAQLRKYSRLFTVPYFSASWAQHRRGWFPVMSYFCKPPPPPPPLKTVSPHLVKICFLSFICSKGFKPTLLLLTNETSHMDLVYESSRMIPTFPSFLHI